MESSPEAPPLQQCTADRPSAIINRSYALVYLLGLIALIYYRLSTFPPKVPLPLLIVVFASELLLSFIWLLSQAYLWNPVSRTTFPERLPQDKELPGIDVLICTANPKKEPALEVMNTVLSAMALDYPAEKMAVYVSDDGGSSSTFKCLRESWAFARDWVPFCTRFEVKCRCPKVYFASLALEDDEGGNYCRQDFKAEREKIKCKYELFKDRIEREMESEETKRGRNQDHRTVFEVMHENDNANDEHFKLPRLVYVSREKRPNHRHHFKAGALNVLLRVSGIMSNSPYILVLDCDMYCNDPASAKQAMCFHLDRKLAPSLAFVQFPQKFHNICQKNDVYDAQLRTIFALRWPGMDGLQGPMLSGTGFFMKRQALYGDMSQKDPLELKRLFGHSNEFILSIHQNNEKNMIRNIDSLSKLHHDAKFLANSAYEKNNSWGEKVGFLYHSLVEDYFTGFILHCKGWNSVLCNPSRPAFLGRATTNLNDLFFQGRRWNCGLMEVTFSRFCPFLYGISRMSLLQGMCYGYYSIQPFYALPLLCLSTIPQLCLLNGISIYPRVSTPWFMIFLFLFLASSFKHLQEVFWTGGSIQDWWNQQRIWMIRSVTLYMYGILDAILKWVGIKEASFLPTNKVSDKEQDTLYRQGKLNFQASTVFLVSIVTLVILNVISLSGGIARMIITGAWNEMLGQVLLCIYIVAASTPIIEGMLLRKDMGRIPVSASILSSVIALTLSFGSAILRC